ncbi:MAG: serine/threonine protein kinase [Gemmataceae bacterium]|nr:serine/threonine protein kinase [Gemmataceae bacterium]
MHPPSIPGYRPLRYLGGGKLFQVWEARPDDDVVPVVLKTPRPEAAARKTVLTLLRREARAGLRVRHPRLGRVLRAHLAEPPHAVVFELVLGESLKDQLRRVGRLSIRSAVWVARQVAEGLAALHRAGFVHADVKPGNVLVTPTGATKLIDFGFTHKRGENRKLTESGIVIGTANYLAPELCLKPVREGPAADVFALGVMFFECLTGTVPYPAQTAAEAIQLRQKAEPTDLTDVPGKWPARVVEGVRAMLRRDPRDRPVAATVVRDLVRTEIELLRRSSPAAA